MIQFNRINIRCFGAQGVLKLESKHLFETFILEILFCVFLFLKLPTIIFFGNKFESQAKQYLSPFQIATSLF